MVFICIYSFNYIYLQEVLSIERSISMAIVKGPIQLEGNVGNLSFYKRRDSDKIIVRSKGGASKEKIKKSAAFKGFRLQQNEWRGCTAFASKLRYAFGGLHRVADYNLTPVLNAFAKNVQKTDTENPDGKREISLSNYRHTLSDFNFNRNYPFNTVLRVSVYAEIDRENLTAKVHIPYIDTTSDLLNVQRLPYFRLLVSLGAVSDMKCDKNGVYSPLVEEMHGISKTITGAWLPSENLLQAQSIEVRLDERNILLMADAVSLVVSMAIEFGKVGFGGELQAVKYAGSGKVLTCG